MNGTGLEFSGRVNLCVPTKEVTDHSLKYFTIKGWIKPTIFWFALKTYIKVYRRKYKYFLSLDLNQFFIYKIKVYYEKLTIWANVINRLKSSQKRHVLVIVPENHSPWLPCRSPVYPSTFRLFSFLIIPLTPLPFRVVLVSTVSKERVPSIRNRYPWDGTYNLF